MFKTADPTRKTPVWLQAYTKENAIWQTKMLVLVLAAMYAKDVYDERKLRKELKKIPTK